MHSPDQIVIFANKPNIALPEPKPLCHGLFYSIAKLDYENRQKLMHWCQLEWQQKRSCGVFDFKPIRGLFFDMDSTVIAQESIVILAAAAGRQNEVDKITEQAMAGELDFDQALKQRVRMLAGISSASIQGVLEQVTINPGMSDLINCAKQRNIACFLISGGFTHFADAIGQKLGFTGIASNQLEIKDGVLTGEVIGPIVNAEYKKSYLEKICQQYNWQPATIAAVGDGANDAKMLDRAGLKVGYQPKPILHQHINLANYSGSHKLLQELLLITNKI